MFPACLQGKKHTIMFATHTCTKSKVCVPFPLILDRQIRGELRESGKRLPKLPPGIFTSIEYSVAAISRLQRTLDAQQLRRLRASAVDLAHVGGISESSHRSMSDAAMEEVRKRVSALVELGDMAAVLAQEHAHVGRGCDAAVLMCSYVLRESKARTLEQRGVERILGAKTALTSSSQHTQLVGEGEACLEEAKSTLLALGQLHELVTGLARGLRCILDALAPLLDLGKTRCYGDVARRLLRSFEKVQVGLRGMAQVSLAFVCLPVKA